MTTHKLLDKLKQYWLTRPLRIAIAVMILFGYVGYAQYQMYQRLETQLANVQKPFALPDELLASRLSGLKIRLTDLTKDFGLIENKIYENCVFFGPCVIQFQDPVQVNGMIIEVRSADDLAAVFISSTNDRLMGITAFKNCIFNNCTFIHIGIIAKPEAIEIMKTRTRIIE